MFKSRCVMFLISISIFSFSAIVNVAYGQTEKINGFKTIDQVLEKIEQKQKVELTLKKEFALKNIPYQVKEEALPKVREQLLLCHDESTAWLELTNYKFLVTGQESNRLVTISIGKPAKEKITGNTTKKAIEIFDPEAAFVFQDAILFHWDKLGSNPPASSVTTLAKIIQIGYDALSYHFGAKNSLEISEITESINSLEDLSLFISSNQEKYKEQQKKLNRLITSEDIEAKEKLGFTTYYPNPIYLGDIAWYLRPQNMDYKDYARYGKIESSSESLGLACEPGILSKSNNANFTEHDDYARILERIYPKKPITNYCHTKYHEYKSSDFKRLSAYVFRGDSRSLEDIHETGGFWARLDFKGECAKSESCEEYKEFDASKDLEILKGIDEVWKFSENTPYPYSADRAYVAPARKLGVAKNFGTSGNVYALFVKNGIELPYIAADQNIVDTFFKEVAAPAGINWDNVIGMKNNNNNIWLAPVFLKNGFELADADNFWEILQLFGGKPQCVNRENRLALIKNCKDIFDSHDTTNASNCENYFHKLIRFNQKDAQAICLAFSEKCSYIIGADKNNKICADLIHTTLGLQNADRRR